MPLNLTPNEGGEFVPYIKYNSKAGRWYAKPKEGREVEVVNPRLAYDFAHIKTGWIMFSEGMGPISVWDKADDMAVKPEGKYKRGFHVMVFGADSLPGLGPLGLREFTSTANVVITPILTMYNQYEAEMAQHPNQIPVFQCLGVTPVTGANGTNFEPGFQLTAWVDRNRVPAFDEELRKVPAQAADPFPPPGVSRGMPDMDAHGPNPRSVMPPPDVNAPLATAPQGGGAYIPLSGPIEDDEIPF